MTEIEEIDNPQRGCGYLTENNIYLKADMSLLGGLPAFVKFIDPIPYLEQHYRGIKLINGLQFEMEHVQLVTEPPMEIEAHLSRLQSTPLKKITNFASLISPFAFDILMWVGKEYYKTPEEFIEEAQTMGVSKKIQLTTPPVIMGGVTKLYLIHPHACGQNQPGIFGYSYLTRAIYTKNDKLGIPNWVNDLEKIGRINVVKVGQKRIKNQKNLGDVS